MARITFGTQGEAGEAEAKAKAEVKKAAPDFLSEVPEATAVEEFFVGGFVRIWGSWVYITQLSEQQVVAVAKMRLAAFTRWLATALTQGVEGWSAEPTWGLRALPRFAKADWAASRYGVVFHPEGEEPPYSKGAFLSAWVATAILNGGSYPKVEDWGWRNSTTWYVPSSYQDAPLTYRGQELSFAIFSMARDYLKGQERKQQKLFNNTNTIEEEEDTPF